MEPSVSSSPTPQPRAAKREQPGLAVLIAELASAGLVSVEVDEDGDVAYSITRRGQRTARMMAMSKDGHALVLLGALVGSEHGPN